MRGRGGREGREGRKGMGEGGEGVPVMEAVRSEEEVLRPFLAARFLVTKCPPT